MAELEYMLRVRMTNEEQRMLQELAEAASVTASELVRQLIRREHAAGQHGVGEPSEGPSWNPLIETSRSEAKSLLAEALKSERRLTRFGIGIYDEHKQRRDAMRTGTAADIERKIAAERAELSEHLDEIAASADWIKRQQPIASFNKRHTSYGYKHNVERWFSDRGSRMYVSNGGFIAAALGLGWVAHLESPRSPNVEFKFSERTIRTLGIARPPTGRR